MEDAVDAYDAVVKEVAQYHNLLVALVSFLSLINVAKKVRNGFVAWAAKDLPGGAPDNVRCQGSVWGLQDFAYTSYCHQNPAKMNRSMRTPITPDAPIKSW